MNPRFGKRVWVKLWAEEWLDGTTRFEMSDAQRAFWIDLLALAGRSRFPGRICAGEVNGSYVGYPLGKFQALMAEPIDIWETLCLFEKTGKIKLTVTAETPVKLVMIELLNWGRYQSEYQRQKPYRTQKLQRSDSQSYNLSDSKGNTTEVRSKKLRSEKKNKTSADAPVVFVRPDWIPERPWAAFLEMRGKMRRPFTDAAKKLIVASLAKLKAQGEDVGSVLEASVANGWAGVFAVRKDAARGNNRKPTNAVNSGRPTNFAANLTELPEL